MRDHCCKAAIGELAGLYSWPGERPAEGGLCWADGIDGPRPGLQVRPRRTEVDHTPQTQLKEEIDAISGTRAPRAAART